MLNRPDINLIFMLENEYDHFTRSQRIAIFNSLRKVDWTPDQYDSIAQSEDVLTATPSEGSKEGWRKKITDAGDNLLINLIRPGRMELPPREAEPESRGSGQQESRRSSDGDPDETEDRYPSASALFGLPAAAPGEAFAAYAGNSWREKCRRWDDASAGRNLQLEPHPGVRRLYDDDGQLGDIVKAIKRGEDVSSLMQDLDSHIGPDEPQQHSAAYMQELRAGSGPWPVPEVPEARR